MKTIWISFFVLATVGSIYPFDFQFSLLNTDSVLAFFWTCCEQAGRGDILGNVILFMPIGFTGMLAGRSAARQKRRFVFVCLLAATVAFALQLLQLVLPSRDENLQDVIWNTVGTIAGAALAHTYRVIFPQSKQVHVDLSLIPLMLIAAWLIYRLIPFVPSIDLQLIKDSIKPILHEPAMLSNALSDFAAWTLVAWLVSQLQLRDGLDRYVPIAILAVFSLEILIVDNYLSRSNLLGAALAMAVWFAWLRNVRRQEPILIALVLTALAVTAIAPFRLRTEPAQFSWLPFRGFLGGSMYVNAQSAAVKLFMYGTLVYLVRRLGTNTGLATSIGVVAVMLLEMVQKFFVGHTPEVTDPALVLLAAAAMFALGRNEESRSTPTSDAPMAKLGTLDSTAVRASGRLTASPAWTTQIVNLRGPQHDFVLQLASEMDASASQVVRKIVQQFMDELDSDNARPLPESHELASDERTDIVQLPMFTGESGPRWSRQTVNLRAAQYRFLISLAAELEYSVSGTIRSIIARFMHESEEGGASSPDHDDKG